MNSLIFTPAKIFTSVLIPFLVMSAGAEGWKIDFSRRAKDKPASKLSESPSEVQADGGRNFFSSLFDSSEPVQELVILNTEKGFVPATVRVRQGGNYRIHVVNVNERERNVSFVLDAFSEHHATYFGKIRTFDIRPKHNGVFRFVSPETSAQGRLVVFSAQDVAPATGEVRTPAGENP